MDIFRVLIACPSTGKATPTGHEIPDLAAFSFIGLLPAEVACQHCPERHTWQRKDAWVEHKNASRVRYPASVDGTGTR